MTAYAQVKIPNNIKDNSEATEKGSHRGGVLLLLRADEPGDFEVGVGSHFPGEDLMRRCRRTGCQQMPGTKGWGESG